MKLNNKGFAITAVLYGLLILFVILVSSYLLVLSAKKNRVDDLVNGIEDEYLGKNEIVNLKDYITNLYIDSNPTEVNDNNIGIRYYYSYLNNKKSWGLINDGLGGLGNSIGNIRYFGDNPNNYIYFNCSDYNNQSSSTCEKWRIVGIVDDKVKIMKNSSIGNYSWNDNLVNNWDNSSLEELLNDGEYYLDIQSKNSETINLISPNSWYVNKCNTVMELPNEMYIQERNGEDIWSGNIALLYPSDYGYAADLNKCKHVLSEYDNCNSYNWMTNIFIDDENSGWLLNPYAINNAYVLNVYYSGRHR